MNKVNELFAIPTGLEPVVLSGVKFFTSDNLKNSFKIAFSKSSKGNHIVPEIEKLIDSNIVIPCFKSKNILSFLKNKIFNDNKYIVAYYDIDAKRVVVIIDNNISIFGTASNNELASTTMHECMHLATGRNLSKFMSIFLPYLVSYYSEFFKDYFSLKNVDKKKILDIIKYLVNFERKGPRYANTKLNEYYKLIYELFKDDTEYNDQQFQSLLTNMIVALKLFIVNMNALVKNAQNFSMIFTSLNRAYFNAFGEKNNYTTPIQELSGLSEVACVLAEMKPKDPVIKKLFGIID